MPTKPVDRKARKGKKEKTTVEKLSTETVSGSSRNTTTVKTTRVKKLTSKDKTQQKKTKKTKSLSRRVLSWSIAAYLGYYTLTGCGSPFDQDTQKPAICGPIDTLKLDAYGLFENKIVPYAYPVYVSKVHPYVSPIANKTMAYYEQYGIPAQNQLMDYYRLYGVPAQNQLMDYYKLYGIPAQTRLVEYYDQHGKPVVDQTSARVKQVYYQKLTPSASFYLDQAKTKAEPHLQKTQLFVQQQWENAPPHIKRAFYTTLKSVQDAYIKAENTDVLPILIETYYRIIEFFQYELWPAIQASPVTRQIKLNYDQHVKAYVDLHLKPLWAKYNDRVHLDQLLSHLLAALPQRPKSTSSSSFSSSGLLKQTVGSSIGQVKTPVSSETVSEAQEIPITPATAVSGVTKSTEEALPATPAPVVEQPPAQQDQKQSNTSQASSTTTTTTTATTSHSITTSVNTHEKQASSTIKSVHDHHHYHHDDVIEDKSVSPESTAQDTNSGQIIVSPTDKHVAPIPQKEQEVAEKKTVPPPQSPTHFEAQDDAALPEQQQEETRDQIGSNKEQWAVPPVDQETIKDKIVKPVQEKVIEPIQHTVDEIKEKLHLKKEQVSEEKPVEGKLVDQKVDINQEKVLETAPDKKEVVKPLDQREEKTIEPEVAKPIEFNVKDTMKVIKEPAQKVLHATESAPKEEEKLDDASKKDPVVVDQKQAAVPTSSKPEPKQVVDDTLEAKEQVSKDIPPIVIEEFKIVEGEEGEIVIDNKPIVADDESQFVAS